MKFALIDNIKTEPAKGLKGLCPICRAEVIAKCGTIKVHHWAHKGRLNCDPWWENETEWHRFWKNQFPLQWQEVVHADENGERHIADVKTDEDWVLEFQHSPIIAEEKHARNKFYSKIIWVVDARRLSNDIKKFEEILNSSRHLMYSTVPIYQIKNPNESRLLREWAGSNIPVFLDFHESNSRLWLILPRNSKDEVYMIAFSGAEFIRINNQKGFNEMAFKLIPDINQYINRIKTSSIRISLIPPNRRNRRF